MAAETDLKHSSTDKIFYFRQFTVNQTLSPLGVNTDAVLLGSWTTFEHAEKILDVGTGTGVVALMLAQRHSGYIKGIDINEKAVRESGENFKRSPWSNRMHSRQISVQDLRLTGQVYDAIVCNPPFYTSCFLSADIEKSGARHADVFLPMEDLFLSVNSLLRDEGDFAMILPSVLFEKALLLGALHGLKLMRQANVKTHAQKPFKRMLLHFKKTTAAIKPFVEEISIERMPNGDYHQDYKNLTSSYLLERHERQAIIR